MGFRQKSRGIRFGFLEYVAVLLVVLTTAAGIGWRYVSPTTTWITVPARVFAVSLVENTHAIEASRPSMRVHFDYRVGGRVYPGDAQFDRITRMLYGALPEEIQELLRSKGYLSFKDLPADIQELLRTKGITSFEQVPLRVLDALRAQGYNSVQDFSEDVERLVRAGEYAQAVEAAGFSEETLAALMAASMVYEEGEQTDSGREETLGDIVASSMRVVAEAPSSRPAPVSAGTILRVRYDPADPTRYEVVRFPYLDAILSIGVFIALAAVTLFYCGVIYPRIKQR
ncbi:MAG: hypothetical protein L3K26_02880 [Candidatus Hydrogenedentes bacterium]|nr:hypothetical protein [Candidatus Hydrogenedentota bacterium]